MNPKLIEGQAVNLQNLLQDWIPNLQELAPAQWIGQVQQGCGPLLIKLAEGWLLFSMKIPDNLPSPDLSSEYSCFSRFLRLNHRLEGGVKFALYPPSQLWLSAAIPVASPKSLPQSRVKAVIAGIHQAVQLVEDHETQEGAITNDGVPLATGPEEGRPPFSLNLLQELLNETAWALSEYRQQDLAIPLPVKQGNWHAYLRGSGDQGVLTVPLCGLPDRPMQREGLAWLMLSISGQVRNVRAVIGPRQETQPLTGGFEVLLSNPLSASDLSQGLIALTLACDLGAAEVRLISEEFSVAECFVHHQSSALQDWRACNHKEVL